MEPTLGWMTLVGITLISLGAAVLTAAAGLIVRERRVPAVSPVVGQTLDRLDSEEPSAVEESPQDHVLDAIEARIDEIARRIDGLLPPEEETTQGVARHSRQDG